MPKKLITAPEAEALTLTDVKKFLRIDGTDEDDVLNDLIKSARDYAEKYQNRKLITQTWELYLDEWPNGFIEISPSLQSVTSVKYTTKDGVENTFDSSNYIVDAVSLIGKIVLKDGKTWPSDTLQAVNGIVIRYVCGYGAAGSNVPELTKMGMKVLIAHRYLNREDETCKEADRMLGFERVMPV